MYIYIHKKYIYVLSYNNLYVNLIFTIITFSKEIFLLLFHKIFSSYLLEFDFLFDLCFAKLTE